MMFDGPRRGRRKGWRAVTNRTGIFAGDARAGLTVGLIYCRWHPVSFIGPSWGNY